MATSFVADTTSTNPSWIERFLNFATGRLAADVEAPVAVASEQMRDGTVGTAYTDTVLGINGTSAYSFAVSSGTLPPGLSLNASTGVVSGTPTAVGSSTFTITVTDAVGNTASRSFTVVIAAAPEAAYPFVA